MYKMGKVVNMKRNTGLDFLKFICSFLIICIHAPYPKTTGVIMTSLSRIAVPVFFMITGYFYGMVKESGGKIRQIKKIAKLLVGANALYFFYGWFKNIINGKEIMGFLSSLFNLKSMFKFVVLNESPISFHLWYLCAIVYVLIIVYFFEKKWKREKLYPFIPVLLLTDLVLGKYSRLILGIELPFILVRNFLCVGLPYFLIGDILSMNKTKIKSLSLCLLIFAFILINILENFL